MVKAYPAPKPRRPQWLWIVYSYILCLGAGTVAALMGLGGFDFAFIAYTTPGMPAATVTIAGLAIFSLPFLARLTLSTLARAWSALFAVVTPFVLLAYLTLLMIQPIIIPNGFILVAAGVLALMGLASFTALGGNRALAAFSKK